MGWEGIDILADSAETAVCETTPRVRKASRVALAVRWAAILWVTASSTGMDAHD